MVVCEMCGRSASLRRADVEGVELNVCSSCSHYGIVRNSSRPAKTYHRRRSERQEVEYMIVSNYASLLRKAREDKGMSHEDFSKLLQERESTLSKWEQGIMTPSLQTARKLEKKLGIRLTKEEDIPEASVTVSKQNDSFTLGDFIKVRKRK